MDRESAIDNQCSADFSTQKPCGGIKELSQVSLTLKMPKHNNCHLPVTQKVIVANSVDPDQSSLIWVHTVCLHAKSRFEKFARRCSRGHKHVTFSDIVFLGILTLVLLNPNMQVQTV